ncbi:hypothetical protein ACHAXA_003792 [Cyclostephanos tholiformis]|uniref:Uncharacterized protein n=1 Tax=Cyclostephanos tholiformis TaxID=382380 RepID=A0ABD3R706_9STRA
MAKTGGRGGGDREICERLLGMIADTRTAYLDGIGMKLLHLLIFVEWNVESIIKVVKKHDKLLAAWESNGGARGERDGDDGEGGGIHHRGGGADASSYSAASSSRNYHRRGRRRLRREYLPRFAIYSPDPNVRCLYGAAADAGNDKRAVIGAGDFAYDDDYHLVPSYAGGGGGANRRGGDRPPSADGTWCSTNWESRCGSCSSWRMRFVMAMMPRNRIRMRIRHRRRR